MTFFVRIFASNGTDTALVETRHIPATNNASAKSYAKATCESWAGKLGISGRVDLMCGDEYPQRINGRMERICSFNVA